MGAAARLSPPVEALVCPVAVDPEAVWLEVGDAGPGIPPRDRARILELTVRSQADRRYPPGMGLGLSIARDRIVAHGGRLDVEGAPGRGSRFTLCIPRDL